MAHLIRRGRSRYVAFSLLLASASVLSMRARAIECDKSQPKQACDINIDPSTVVNGRTFRVRNGTPVTVTVYPKSPFEKCSMAVKERKDIIVENAFQTFLSTIMTAGVPIALLESALGFQRAANTQAITAIDRARAKTQPQSSIQDTLSRIQELLNTIETRETEVSADLKKQYEQVRLLAGKIDELRLYPARGKTNQNEMVVAFTADRDKIIADIDDFRDKSRIPETSAISGSINEAADLIKSIESYLLSADSTLLAQLNQALAKARSTLARINEAIASLEDAEKRLYAQRDFPVALPVLFSASFHYSDMNSVVRLEVSCVDQQSKLPTAMGAVPFTIEFKDLPRATVSLGVLISTLDKREIGLVNVKSETPANGSHKELGETDRAGLQIIPFSYLNVRFWNRAWRGREFVFNVSEGFGINPNNGGKDPEFFSGISIGMEDLYFQIGQHHGKWQELGGGFSLGETISEDLSPIPVARRYTHHWAFGVSYRPPPKQ